MNAPYRIRVGFVDSTTLDEIMDWLDDRSIHYYPLIVMIGHTDHADLTVDIPDLQAALWFKLVWGYV